MESKMKFRFVMVRKVSGEEKEIGTGSLQQGETLLSYKSERVLRLHNIFAYPIGKGNVYNYRTELGELGPGWKKLYSVN